MIHCHYAEKGLKKSECRLWPTKMLCVWLLERIGFLTDGACLKHDWTFFWGVGRSEGTSRAAKLRVKPKECYDIKLFSFFRFFYFLNMDAPISILIR